MGGSWEEGLGGWGGVWENGVGVGVGVVRVRVAGVIN